MVADETGLYWTGADVEHATASLLKTSFDGGTVILTSSNVIPSAPVVDAKNIYWGEPGAVKQMPLAGGDVVTVTTDAEGARGLTVDSTTIYWFDALAIKSAPIGGGATTTVLDTSDQGAAFYIQSLAVDETSLYGIGEDGLLFKVTPK